MARLGIEELESRILLAADNHLFVNTLYQDLLHRTAEPSGLAFWTSVLEHGASREQVALGMMSASDEYLTNKIQFMYQDLLKRPADAGGSSFFLTAMKSGITDEQAKADIIGSTEYLQTRADHSNAGFLTAAYEDIFIRDADPAGQAFFTQELSQGTSRTDVATQMLASAEYREDVAEGFYEQFLFRTGEAGGLGFWATHLLQGGTYEQVLAGFPGSPEYSTQIEHRQPLAGRAPLAVPGTSGQTVATTFTLVGAATGTPDSLGFFMVDAPGGSARSAPAIPAMPKRHCQAPQARSSLLRASQWAPSRPSTCPRAVSSHFI
jgi:hypothetical protein